MVSIPEAIVSGTPILTNTQPASVEYIRANGLGIVKDNWDEYDLKKSSTKIRTTCRIALHTGIS